MTGTRGGAAEERIEVRRGDVAALAVDAVVNAANPLLAPGGGVCGAIHAAAGPRLAEACRPLAPCPPGEARVTPGFNLRARHVIHAVGPVWNGGTEGEEELLARAYESALALAREVGSDTVAFPAISTGIYGYPLDEACAVAVAAVRRFLRASPRPRRVFLVAFDARTEAALREALAADAGGAPRNPL